MDFPTQRHLVCVSGADQQRERAERAVPYANGVHRRGVRVLLLLSSVGFVRVVCAKTYIEFPTKLDVRRGPGG